LRESGRAGSGGYGCAPSRSAHHGGPSCAFPCRRVLRHWCGGSARAGHIKLEERKAVLQGSAKQAYKLRARQRWLGRVIAPDTSQKEKSGDAGSSFGFRSFFKRVFPPERGRTSGIPRLLHRKRCNETISNPDAQALRAICVSSVEESHHAILIDSFSMTRSRQVVRRTSRLNFVSSKGVARCMVHILSQMRTSPTFH
jgi:hypothetical protein